MHPDLERRVCTSAKKRLNRDKPVHTGEHRPPPPHLEEKFKDRRELLHAIAGINFATSVLAAWEREGKTFDIDVQKIREHLAAAYQEFFDGVPHKPCSCEPLTDCEVCGGRRWISRKQLALHEQKFGAPSASNA
jgi:hypothetical protein